MLSERDIYGKKRYLEMYPDKKKEEIPLWFKITVVSSMVAVFASLLYLVTELKI